MSTEDAAIGFDSVPRRRMPYSVSIPSTLRMATRATYPPAGAVPRPEPRLEVLASADPFDGPATGGLLALREQHAEEHDALALLARDLGPVVRVGGVGQVLVLLVLLPDRLEEVVGADASAVAGDLALDGQLLGPPHDVLDHLS